MKKSLLIGSGVFLVLGFSLAAAAHASLAPSPAPCATVGTPFVTLTQRITNDPDSGNHGNWATDAFTEQVNVWVGTDGKTYCANANTADGTFVTTGPNSPEKGTPLAAGITGTFTGGENYTIPSSVALSPDYSTSTPKSVALPDSSTAGFSWWVNNVFPSIATSSGADYTNTYSLTYVTSHDGTWTDADPASGGDVGDIGPVVDMNTGTGYSTIQEAVDAASAGDTIAVSAGTYPETVSIAKPLVLDGAQMGVAGGNASGTPRSGPESIVNAMNIAASNVVINGFSFVNPGVQVNIASPAILSGVAVENNIFSGYAGVGMPTDLAGNLVVEGNLFHDPAPNSEPMQIKSDGTTGGCTGTEVVDNIFSAAANNNGADINFSCTGSDSSDVTVSGNVDNGNTNGSSFVAFSGVSGGIAVNHNHATGISGSAVFFFGDVSGDANITDNTITGGGSSAISIHGNDAYGTPGAPNSGSFMIADNDLSGNMRGVYLGDDGGAFTPAASVTILGNDFASDTVAGVENSSTVLTAADVNATGNWWGAMNGPLDTVSGDGSTPDTNASGTGSPVAGAVKYSGWCVNASCLPPSLTITAPAADGDYVTSTYDFTASYLNGVTNSFNWAIRAGAGCSTGTVAGDVDGFNGSSTFSGGTFHAVLDTTRWMNGEYCFVINDMNGLRATRLFAVSNGGPSVPTLLWPVNGDIEPTNDFYFKWSPSTETPSSTITYEFHSSQDPAETNGVLTTGLWTSPVLATSSIHSTGAPDGAWYWQVRAIDAAGNMSAWSPIWTMTIDTVPPPALAACPVGTGASLVEADAVNSASYAPTVGANALMAGKTYLLVASGTWKNANLNVADPAYASVDDWTTFMRGYDIPPYYEGSNDLELQVDNAFVNWGPYQPSHEYAYRYVGAGNPVSFRVFDGDANASSAAPTASWYGDNAGTLNVDVYACNAPVYVTTDAATNVTATDAVLNGTNGNYAAAHHSFWVSTSTFSTSTPTIPAGVYSSPDLGTIASGTPFAFSLSSLAMNAVVHGQVTGTMPAVQPDTTYYYVAWSYVNGAWHSGAMQRVTTASNYVTTDAATDVGAYEATVNGTNGSFGAEDTSFWWGTTPAGPFDAGKNATEFPATGWKHDGGLGAKSAGGAFSEALTGLTPNTTYYFVAWSEVGGEWYPGDTLTFATPAPGSDASLSALGVSNGMLSPSFDSGTLAYTDALPYATTLVPTVAATTTDPNATMIIAPATGLPGTSTVAVTAQDGVTKMDYTVAFTLLPSTSSTLNVIVPVNNGEGGSATSSDFTVTLHATGASTSSFPGSARGTAVTMDPNTFYSVDVSGPSDYEQGISGNCYSESGIPPGGSATCTVTETYTQENEDFVLGPRVIVSGGPSAGGTGGNGEGGGGGEVLGASVSGNGALQAELQALMQKYLSLLEQYLALLQQPHR